MPSGVTDQMGIAVLVNFSISGPGGLYTLMPQAAGVNARQDSAMLMSTPVASIEVVNDSLYLGPVARWIMVVSAKILSAFCKG